MSEEMTEERLAALVEILNDVQGSFVEELEAEIRRCWGEMGRMKEENDVLAKKLHYMEQRTERLKEENDRLNSEADFWLATVCKLARVEEPKKLSIAARNHFMALIREAWGKMKTDVAFVKRISERPLKEQGPPQERRVNPPQGRRVNDE